MRCATETGVHCAAVHGRIWENLVYAACVFEILRIKGNCREL